MIQINFGLVHTPTHFDYEFDFDDLPEDVKSQLPEDTAEVLQLFSDEDLHFLRWRICWQQMARRKQLPPKSFTNMEKFIWMIRSGRGFGKTLTGSNWIGEMAWLYASFYAVVSPTHDDVRYTCFEGPTGLLSVIPPQLIADRNQALPSITLKNGSIIRGFAGDTPERLRGPQHAAIWCLKHDTLVLTSTGEKSIVDVQVGDFIVTRFGYKRVLASEMTHPNAEIWKVSVSGHRDIEGTSDHPVYVEGKGFIPLCQLSPGAKLLSFKNVSISNNLRDTSCGLSAWDPAKKIRDFVNTFIERFTNTIVAQSPKVISCITKMVTARIIALETWNACLGGSTLNYTIPATIGWASKPEANNLSKTGTFESYKHLPAFGADLGLNLKHLSHADSATRNVEKSIVGRIENTKKREPVYNLTIEGAHEFFANGLLVHNCDEIASWKYPQEAWDNLMFGLRLGDSPRICVTGTPKPSPFIRRLQKDKRTVDIVGATYENRENLTEYFFESIAKYEGTRVGRQEIHGEVLDPEEEGFVKRSQWKIWPPDQALPKFSFVVMSLDPAFTERNYDKRRQENDPTACSVWGVFSQPREGKPPLPQVMLLDAWEDWLGFPSLVRRIKKEKEYTYGDIDEPVLKPRIVPKARRAKHQGRHADIILIEEKASGISLRQQLAEENILTHGYNPGNEDKLTRLHYVSPMFAAGRVWAVESEINPGNFKSWADPLVSQVCSYVGPGSTERDDLLDTATQGLRLIMDKFFGPFTIVENVETREQDRAREIARRRLKKKLNPYD